ncbi:hypothetical protein P0D88_35015 [Paraburkholderia sp. RL18-103-BIB-C]|uniref:hypothetical protein n=1 Tax=Paraburkholderia sp. RL18-103-BIB-C TaxID=3031637 RepID=UPI0038BCE2E6
METGSEHERRRYGDGGCELMAAWAQEFERVRPLIEAALEYSDGTHTIDDVREFIATGRAQLWPGKTAVVVTEIVHYPQRKTCNGWLAAGDNAELAEMYKSIEAWAKAAGCKRATIIGRRGWAKTYLADYGYTPKWVTFSKDI